MESVRPGFRKSGRARWRRKSNSPGLRYDPNPALRSVASLRGAATHALPKNAYAPRDRNETASRPTVVGAPRCVPDRSFRLASLQRRARGRSRRTRGYGQYRHARAASRYRASWPPCVRARWRAAAGARSRPTHKRRGEIVQEYQTSSGCDDGWTTRQRISSQSIFEVASSKALVRSRVFILSDRPHYAQDRALGVRTTRRAPSVPGIRTQGCPCIQSGNNRSRRRPDQCGSFVPRVSRSAGADIWG